MVTTGSATPESTEEDVLPDDKKPHVAAIDNIKQNEVKENVAAPNANVAAPSPANIPVPQTISTPGLSPSPQHTPDSEELHSPANNHKPVHPSPLHSTGFPTGNIDNAAIYSLNDQFTSASIAPTVGSEQSPHYPSHNLVSDSSFPFPKFRPLASGTATPTPGGDLTERQEGMRIPPATNSGVVTPAVQMSRGVSAASTKDHKSEAASAMTPISQDGPPPSAPMNGRSSRSSSSASKPQMLGAVGEKKSFFHKMFHPNEEKKERERAEKEKANGKSSRGSSPMPSRTSTQSPPPTPGASSTHHTDSENSHPPSRAPSRAPSLKRRISDKRDPHAQPPVDKDAPPVPPLQRKGSQRSASHGSTGGGSKSDGPKVIGTVGNHQTSAPVKKEEVTTSGGTKFTLKDLIGMGDGGPKLNRRTSDKGSTKGSDRGSTKGGSEYGDNNSTASLLKKYGICDKAAIGKGATAVVRLAHKWDRREEKLYAVKEFRKRRKNETEKDYVKKLTSEFCISSTLHHTNVVETVDLVQDEQHHWCEVMEYCPGGDLYAAIKKGGMSSGEVECTFKQVLLGIQYLHSMGVAHRDIKPENLLLDGRGHVKITDFGVSDVFRMCWEKKTHLSKGLCGSEPYIAPELFEHKEYDARFVDVWAAAVVFYCMQFQELPWRVAKLSDSTFSAYLQAYHPKTTLLEGERHPTPPPLNNLIPRECRTVIKHMLDPDPKTRWSVDEALNDKWLMSVEVCVEGEVNSHSHTSAGMDIVKM